MRIEERGDVFIINGLEIDGSISENSFCLVCNSNIIRDDGFDAYFCSKCSNLGCRYCRQRPEYPLPNKWMNSSMNYKGKVYKL